MRVVLSPRAEKNLRKLSKLDQIAVAKKIRAMGGGEVLQREFKLKGYKDIYRVRVGEYRIVFRKQPNEIYLILIRHRRDVYKILKRLLG